MRHSIANLPNSKNLFCIQTEYRHKKVSLFKLKWKEIGVDAGHDVNKFIILISFGRTIRSVENRRDWQTLNDETRYTKNIIFMSIHIN